MTQVFVQVAHFLTDDFDLIDFFRQLSVRCVELLNVAAFGVLLGDEHDRCRNQTPPRRLTQAR